MLPTAVLLAGRRAQLQASAMADAGGPGDSDRAPDADVTVDAAIEHIGGFGAYQRRLFAILGFSFFANGCLNLQQVVSLPHDCRLCSALSRSLALLRARAVSLARSLSRGRRQ